MSRRCGALRLAAAALMIALQASAEEVHYDVTQALQAYPPVASGARVEDDSPALLDAIAYRDLIIEQCLAYEGPRILTQMGGNLLAAGPHRDFSISECAQAQSMLKRWKLETRGGKVFFDGSIYAYGGVPYFEAVARLDAPGDGDSLRIFIRKADDSGWVYQELRLTAADAMESDVSPWGCVATQFTRRVLYGEEIYEALLAAESATQTGDRVTITPAGGGGPVVYRLPRFAVVPYGMHVFPGAERRPWEWRVLGTVVLPNGVELNDALIAQGLAVHLNMFSGEAARYASIYEEAIAAGLGLFSARKPVLRSPWELDFLTEDGESLAAEQVLITGEAYRARAFARGDELMARLASGETALEDLTPEDIGGTWLGTRGRFGGRTAGQVRQAAGLPGKGLLVGVDGAFVYSGKAALEAQTCELPVEVSYVKGERP